MARTGRDAGAQPDGWKRMMLHSMPMPAWLAQDAPHSDVVLSSRVRIMRNVAGFRFPHTAPTEELLAVQKLLLAGAPSELKAFKHLTPAELDHLVGGRLVSTEFPIDQQGRAVLLNAERTTSAMVNEEDHLRLQVLTGGWSAESADSIAKQTLGVFDDKMDWA